MKLKIKNITKLNENYAVTVEGHSDLIRNGIPCNNGENTILSVAMKGGAAIRPMFESTLLLVSGELKDKEYLSI